MCSEKKEKKVQVAWLFGITDQRVSYTVYASQLKILIVFLTQLKILIKHTFRGYWGGGVREVLEVIVDFRYGELFFSLD